MKIIPVGLGLNHADAQRQAGIYDEENSHF